MKHFHKFRTAFLVIVLLANLGAFAQSTFTLPTVCNSCSTPCTAPTALVCDAAATISAGGTATSTVSGGTGGTITWAILPTAGVSTASGSGATTGAITFATAGAYTVTFTSTNSSNPASCSPAATVTCTRTITVNAAPSGSVTAFNCAAAIPSPISYTKNLAYSGTVSLSYTGGNGGAYVAGSVASTGVTGFTATWAAGTLATGAGSITINITGTATVDGAASFPITIAGQSCTITLSSCGAFVAPGQWKAFLCHNLGADPSLDPHTPVVGLQGAYIQWGKRGPNTTGDSRVDWQTAANDGPIGFAAAPTASNPNSAGISGWSTTEATNNAWRTAGGAKTANDPCPAGYRVPTGAEWTGVVNNNTASRTGTWTMGYTEYGSSLHFGPNASTKTLSLPATGFITDSPRFASPGGIGIISRGSYGVYWSSSASSSPTVQNLAFDGSVAVVGTDPRTLGQPVRCIVE